MDAPLTSNSLQHVPLANMGLAARVRATVSMLLHVTWRLDVSVRKDGLDLTAAKVKHNY